jgi:peptidoglycan/xylan/chitin deacetylase (PgdA/CDA1 family)
MLLICCMFYFTKTPWLLKKWYPSCVWNFPSRKKRLYLTFDDGPHPQATPFALHELKKHGAKATFFCIGKNVMEYPQIYKQILLDGHRVGNHTHNHLNGWKVTDKEYFGNIAEAKKYIDSDLFRPPYGRITKFQLNSLTRSAGFKVIMWDVLSGDFDKEISVEKCGMNVKKNARDGSIIIFHDSEKAFGRMQYALAETLDYFSAKGFSFERIDYIL